jgi:hypothetical protein
LFELTNDVIRSTIDNTVAASAYYLHKKTGKDIADMLQELIHSNAYALLADKETGLYWEGYGVFVDTFLSERGNREKAR